MIIFLNVIGVIAMSETRFHLYHREINRDGNRFKEEATHSKYFGQRYEIISRRRCRLKSKRASIITDK